MLQTRFLNYTCLLRVEQYFFITPGFSKKALLLSFLVGMGPLCAWGGLKSNIISDYQHYYTTKSLKKTAVVLSLGGVIANSNMDTVLHNGYQKHMRTEFTNASSRMVTAAIDQPFFQKNTGLCLYIPSYYVGTRFSSRTEGRLAKWAEGSIRTVALLAPQQRLFTGILGASRPTDQKGSKWRRLQGDRAVSGHAAFGAIPLLNVAFQTKSPVTRVLFKVLAMLPGLARINDKKHYTSQVVLGYGLAYMAASTVNRSNG